MTTKEMPADAVEFLNDDVPKDTTWKSNKDDENPKQLPWPEENESKE